MALPAGTAAARQHNMWRRLIMAAVAGSMVDA
jgi:hypothetical protein